MLKMRTVITYRGFDPDDPEKGMWKALRTAFRAAAMFWHWRYLPFHFTPGGARVYGFDRRSGPYEERKLKIKGHRNPLQWSGALKAAAKAPPKITASRRGGTNRITAILRMDVPDYAARRYLRRSMPDMADELVRVRDSELLEIGRVIERVAAVELGRDMTEKTEIAA